ncbi:hypothetical protein K438DRAFT_1941288 [Mycena galopus ATCC 62051]|nr:hypothetical protein K438DRAFT_1941288 [Mycena galopus ATCC 62051]
MSSLCMKTSEHRQECKETKRKCQTNTHGQRRGPKRPVRQALQRERPASAMWAEMTSTASLEVDGYTAASAMPEVGAVADRCLAEDECRAICAGTIALSTMPIVTDAHGHLTSLKDREPSKEQKTRTLESGTFTGGTARLTTDDLLLLHKPPHVRGRALMPDGYECATLTSLSKNSSQIAKIIKFSDAPSNFREKLHKIKRKVFPDGVLQTRRRFAPADHNPAFDAQPALVQCPHYAELPPARPIYSYGGLSWSCFKHSLTLTLSTRLCLSKSSARQVPDEDVAQLVKEWLYKKEKKRAEGGRRMVVHRMCKSLQTRGPMEDDKTQ